MNFLNPFLLIAAAGVALPILAHLLNRYQVKHTDWAAMQFLNRNVRVRSRQLRLRDIFLLILRCLALLLLVLALAKPFSEDSGGMSALGEKRGGVILAVDASYSMQHSDGNSTRFEQALEKVESIAAGIHVGDPVSLVFLGEEHEVVARNMAFDAGRFEEILQAQEIMPEPLNLGSVPQVLKNLATGMEAPQKEIYLITDMQARDWEDRPSWLLKGFEELEEVAPVVIVPVEGGGDNLAITNLELVSGVLRKESIARYRATVKNFGSNPATNVQVKGLADNTLVDTKPIPSIAPGASETVSLFFQFHNAGAVKISAELEDDALASDNSRHTVAVIRERVSILCIEGVSEGGGSGQFIEAALRAHGEDLGNDNFAVQTIPWINLPGQDLATYDVIILQDVPDITPEQALAFESFVRSGKGLIWFAGDQLDIAAWNEHSAGDGVSLLPAVIGDAVSTTDAVGVGKPLDPNMPDHSVCMPLLSLPEDLLSETRFRQILQVQPTATSSTVLSLAGTSEPILIEHSLGRGHVFMFTTSSGSEWNNMAVTPVFPMVLQQMVTYLTAREFEKPVLVGRSLSLSYEEQPDASDAVFDTPSGETLSVPVLEYENQHVALLDNAREAGFYTARVSLQSPGLPIAVNVDTAESDVKSLSSEEVQSTFADTGVRIARSEDELLDLSEELRSGTSFWRICLLAGLGLLVFEGLFASRNHKPEAVAAPSQPNQS